MTLRAYRLGMRTRNQNSPVELHRLVEDSIAGKIVADIGCGNGLQATIARMALSGSGAAKMRFIGVDFSPKAVADLKRRRVYDLAILASSERLPLASRSVDTAMCIENLEHLYAEQVVPAIAELARIARLRVLITTPWPGQAFNREFLKGEIAAAAADPVPMGASEFADLAGYAHKGSVIPSSMLEAGFENPLASNSLVPFSALYVGDPKKIDVSKIRVRGLAFRAYAPKKDHRADYLNLLRESLDTAPSMPWQGRMAAVHGLAFLRQAKGALKTAWAGMRQA
jgi:SAM-dependent methyltransferase